MALALLGAVLLVTAVLAVLVLARRRDAPARPLEREFARLRRGLARRGLNVADCHPPPPWRPPPPAAGPAPPAAPATGGVTSSTWPIAGTAIRRPANYASCAAAAGP
ncbi:hypothetical protein HML84_02070 [Alcanivorax sp. IO_7]|nr:hypothetical protein HML84_02070 [Alcanivorax sp. IO_7]